MGKDAKHWKKKVESFTTYGNEEELLEISTHDVGHNLSDILRCIITGKRFLMTRWGEKEAVIISWDEYKRLTSR